MTFGSLFAGIGGFDLGLERAGMECRWQVEIDPFCRKVLEKHWPHVPKFEDVREFAREENEQLGVDVICGGFPCQDISNAGKRAGIDGERSGLWSEYIRIVRTLRPRFVVVENVAALLVRGIERVLWDLAAGGYDAEWSMFSACRMGAPHMRQRLFVVAYRHQERRNIAGQHTDGGDDVHSRFNAWEASPRGKWSDVERWIGQALEDGRKVLTSSELHGMADGVSNRLERIACCGNAVVPQVAEWIGRRIVESGVDISNDVL